MLIKSDYRVLYDIAKCLSSSLTPNTVLDSIVENGRKVVNAQACSLMLLTDDRTMLVHKVSCGLSDWYMRKGPVSADSIISEVLQGKPVFICDVTKDPRVLYPEEAMREGILSMLSIPVMLRKEVAGVLRIYTAEKRDFSIEEIELLGAIADLGAIALENAKRYSDLDEEFERVTVARSRLEREREQFLKFISIAAHDLKSPLAAIQSYFEVLLGGDAGEINNKQKNIVEKCSRRVLGLLELISDLLDIPRIETGQIISEFKELDLSAEVKALVDELRDVAERKGLNISVQVPSMPALIHGSRNRMKQALSNLLNNAINYTNKGSVSVIVSGLRNKVQVEITDTGIGIPRDDLPHIFEDFFRASNVESKGTGLGLSITKRIIEAHRGRIWIESPPTNAKIGTRFTFTVPRVVENRGT